MELSTVSIAGAPSVDLSSPIPAADTDEHEHTEPMQRPGGMRNYSPSPANSHGGLWTTKSGAIDRHKLALLVICAALALWVVYDM